jgi:hypothetical protein
MAERKRRGRPSKRTLIGPLAFLATGAAASALLWYVLSGGSDGAAVAAHERLDAADRQALENVLRHRSPEH